MKTQKVHIRLKKAKQAEIDYHPYFLSELELTKTQKLHLMRSHYLAPTRLLTLALQSISTTPPPFILQCPESDTVQVIMKNNTTAKIGKDFYFDEITLVAWKMIIALYDHLKTKNLFESFMNTLSDYPKYRVQQFIEEYNDFIKNGDNPAWKDLRSQIELHIYDFIKNNKSDQSIQ